MCMYDRRDFYKGFITKNVYEFGYEIKEIQVLIEECK